MPLAARILILATLGTAALVATPASTAWAQADDARAKELYENGVTLYNEGRNAEAIQAWEEAYRLSNRPKILFNIANAYERMGELNTALDQLFRYKIYAKAEERAQIERRIRALEARIAGGTTIDPVPNPDPVPQPKPAPAPRVRSGGGPSVPGLALLGGGAVALGAGGAFGVISGGAKRSALEFCTEGEGTLYCSSEAEADLNRHRTMAVLADVSFIVGAVAAGTGVVMLATGSGKTQMGVGPNRLFVNGRF